LSDVLAIYPRFAELTSYYTRDETTVTFDFVAPDSFAAEAAFYFRLNAAEAGLERAGTPGCSLKVSGGTTELAQSCSLSRDYVSFSLKEQLVEDETYTVRLSNLPTPDWGTCRADVFQIQVWEDSSTLVALSAPGFFDYEQVDFEESNDEDYSAEVEEVDDRFDVLEFPIGFYSEVVIKPSSSRFSTDVELSASNSGYVSEAGSKETSYYGVFGEGYTGFESASLIVKVDESANESYGYLLIDNDESLISRTPVVSYELYEESGSITINDGKSVYVQNGGDSVRVPVCLGDLIPLEDQTFSLDITVDNSDSDPEIETDVDQITLGPSQLCTSFSVVAGETLAEDGSSVTLTLTSNSDLFPDGSLTISLLEETETENEISAVNTIDETSLTITVATSMRSVLLCYLAPVNHYLLDDDEVTISDITELVDGNRILSSESRTDLQVYVDSEVTFEFTDLLRGNDYQYIIVAISQDDTVTVFTGEVTTSTGDVRSDAIYYEVVLDGSYDDEELLDLICTVAEMYAIPYEDVTNIDGESCAEYIDWFDDEWILTEGDDSESESSSELGSSSDDVRLLQETDSDSMSSSSSEFSDVETVLGILLLPPTRSWVPEYDDDASTFWDLLEDEIDSSYVITSITKMDNLAIDEVDSVTYSDPSSTTDSITISAVEILNSDSESVSGSFCYALWQGAGLSATMNSVKYGTDSVYSGCQYIEADGSYTTTFDGLTADTDYTLAFYATSIDTREFSAATEVTSVEVRTEAEVDEEEEEYGFISSVGFVALLVALFFNF
jgi:hypothetical protein